MGNKKKADEKRSGVEASGKIYRKFCGICRFDCN